MRTGVHGLQGLEIQGLQMTRREQWRKVLDLEVRRWSEMVPDQLAAALEGEHIYQVERDLRIYQIEVKMLESTEEYFHVMVAVDDGGLPEAMLPETESFVRYKTTSSDVKRRS
jgi:hypothetical protein